MLPLPELLSSLNFPEFYDVRNRASIANMFPAAKRCGIYILQFRNDEVYAGQAFDVTRRYVQHSKAHGDIRRISFKQVAKGKLNDEERRVIWELEQNDFHLRNIIFTSIPKGDSDFDLIMSIDDQQKWLEGIHKGISINSDSYSFPIFFQLFSNNSAIISFISAIFVYFTPYCVPGVTLVPWHTNSSCSRSHFNA